MSKQVYNGFKWVTFIIFSLLVISKLSAQDASKDDSEELYTLAKAAGAKGDFAKAASYCERGLRQSPLDMDIKEYLGKCYMEIGQLERARRTLLEVLKSSPRRVDARHYLINIETQSKRYYSAVCYANELLEITPYAKELWIKKVQLYNLMDNRVEANRTAKRLYQIFPEDENVRALYNNFLKDDALRASKGKDYSAAIDQYEKVIDNASTDPEDYISLINAYINTGNYSAALSVADRGLSAVPYNTAILDKKIGILDETNDFQKAIAVTEDRLRKGDSPHYRLILNYLNEKAARFYRNSDPLELYSKIYDKNPGNKEAFDYVLNTSLSRGDHARAEELIKKGLKSNPNSKELLAKQLYLYEAQKNLEKSGVVVERLYALYPNDTDVKEKYQAWTYEKGKRDFMEQNYKEALWNFLKISETPIYGKYASQYLFSIYANQKNYLEATKVIDKLIKDNPTESQHVLNKIDLLISAENYEKAYQLASESYKKNANNPEYKYIYNEATLAYIKDLNTKEDYPKVKQISDELLAINPTNTDAFNYGIGARVAMKQYDEAITFVNGQSNEEKDEKNVQLKLAGIYSQAGNHQLSSAILKDLQQKYPYNDSLRNNLVEEMLMYGKALDDSSKFDLSKKIYAEARQIEPKNTTATLKLTNILIEQGELQTSLLMVDSCLVLNKDNADLLYQKGIIYEKLGDYKKAREYQAAFMGALNTVKKHEERLELLENKELKNQINASYLYSTSDSTLFKTSVATFEYQRDLNKNNTIVARVNYAARVTGVGVQGEVDWYHTFKNKSSFLLNGGVANQFFPNLKASLSFYQPIGKGWQVELGGRYSYKDEIDPLTGTTMSFVTGILGLEKTFDRVWLNGKFLVMSDTYNVYHGVFVQSRFYLRNEKDYVVTMASMGTAPEDQRLLFQINTFTSYVSSMVGAGYYHHFNARTSLGLQGNWYNFRVSPINYINQYNVFLTLRNRF